MMTVPEYEGDDSNNLESLQKFIQGLNYSLILLRFGKNSEEAIEFVDTNPNAEEDLQFVKDIFRETFPNK